MKNRNFGITLNPQIPSSIHTEKTTFAAGCFWGVQAYFDKLNACSAGSVSFYSKIRLSIHRFSGPGQIRNFSRIRSKQYT